MDKAKRSENRKILLKNMFTIIIAVVLTASLLLNLFTFVMSVVKYYGTSMSPTLNDGQILIVNKMADIKEGDIIAFYYNNKVLVRRVIATGNSQVSIDVMGRVAVNGEVLEEPYVENLTLGQCNIDFPYNVPSNAYFVLGDDRESSMDSRLFEIGTVSEDRIIGRVVYSLVPLGLIE